MIRHGLEKRSILENAKLFLLSTGIWNTDNIANIFIPIVAVLFPAIIGFVTISIQNRINRITDEEIKRINEIKHNAIKFIYHRNLCYFYAQNKNSGNVFLEKNNILKYTEKLIFDFDYGKPKEIEIINLIKKFNVEFIPITWELLNDKNKDNKKSYFWQNSEEIIEKINIFTKDEWKRIKKRVKYKEPKEKISVENKKGISRFLGKIKKLAG